MFNFNTDFEFPFPEIADPDGDAKAVKINCYMNQNLNITDCDTCSIKCKKLNDLEYTLSGNYPTSHNTTVSDETVNFRVTLSDDFDESTYNLQILFV